MATLIDIRRRIRSVHNTLQITKAMKLVAASKLRQSKDRMLASRPFSARLLDVLTSLATRANPDDHPLLKVKGDENIELMVITGDKGLCGAFNSNLIKEALRFLDERKNYNLSLHLIGKKGTDFFRRKKYVVSKSYVNVFKNLQFQTAVDIGNNTIKAYIEGNLDAVYIIYNEFKSALAQKVVLHRLLPLERLPEATPEQTLDYIYEPDPFTIFDRLLPQFLQIRIYQALLESYAAENAARMAAMDAATNNARDMIGYLTLQRNKIRQAAITKEILEIVGGSEALK
jgi:F-type H+-transporting ATPase subunit gamma